MGKVKQWAMEEQEKAMARYAEGEINNKECAELLAKFGMDINDIETSIDDLTADHTEAVADKAIEKAKLKYSWWTNVNQCWTTRKKK